MSGLRIDLRRLPHAADLSLPRYASRQAAGMDLAAAVETPVVLGPGERARVPTGFAIAVPDGFEAQVRPRSGLADRHGVTVLNAPGTIDADYRGEIGIVLINHGPEPVTVERGMRIAQLIIAPVVQAVWHEVAVLAPTDRGSGGFGSTGTADPPTAERPPEGAGS